MINVQYEAPEGRLAQSVSTFYRFDYDGDELSELERADRAQLRFMLKGPARYQFADGNVVDVAPVTIIGPTTAPARAMADNPVIIFGWGLLPAGWASLMGKAAECWVDKSLDAREIFGDSIMDVHQRLLDAPDFETQVQIGMAAAREIHTACDTAPFEFTAKVDKWLLENTDPDVEVLAGATSLSPRQLERMTKRYYGMPPKKLARKYRALRAAQVLANGDSLDDSDLGLAFYDQSHLIREVKQFTGLTPTQLRSGSSALTQVTMEGRNALGSKVSSLISKS